MSNKNSYLDRRTIFERATISLDDLYVYDRVAGAKRASTRSMTVADLIDKLREYNLDSTLDFDYDSGYYGDTTTHSLVINSNRLETDKEYEARMEQIRRDEECAKKRAIAKKEAAKNKKLETKKAELELLAKLAKKYNIKDIEKDINIS